MSEDTPIRRAEFDPRVCTYWLLSGIIVLTVTIIGIPLLLLWIPLGRLVTGIYLSRLECVLTHKTLKVGKGMLVRVEKTIPLEKITDMGMVQGPIMRAFGLRKLTVETAGQSSGPGSLVSLTGVVDTLGFREAVLAQRDALAAEGKAAPAAPGEDSRSKVDLLVEIRDSLHRIERTLGQRQPPPSEQ